MYQAKDDRSLGELFGELASEFSMLMRQEIALARTEVTDKAARAGRNVAFLALGGAVAYAGFLAIVAAVAIGLGALGLPWWLSALLVGVVVALAGYFFIRKGLDGLKEVELAPRQTVETIKEGAEWARHQMR